MRWYESLRRPREFAAVRRRGRRERRATVDVFAVDRADAAVVRVGITVGKRVGGAVVRNLVRRRIQGALVPLGEPDGFPAVDLVFIAAPAAAGARFEQLASDVASALGRLLVRRAP